MAPCERKADRLDLPIVAILPPATSTCPECPGSASVLPLSGLGSWDKIATTRAKRQAELRSMATAVQAPPTVASLSDPRIKEKLQALRHTDNVTNLFYLARTYLYLTVVIGGALTFFAFNEWAWWLNVPITLLAILLIGAGQHQLTGLAHEASHHILFRNRFWNDLASDWLCMFPLFSSTQHYRLQHIAHHQFVNDPQRDPDVSQLQTSGHWLHFPVDKKTFLVTLLKQLWLPNLVRFMRIRAAYNAIPTDKNPYLKAASASSTCSP
jgi:fatty acid desaturase